MTDLDLDATLAAGEQMCQIFTVGPRGTSWRIDDVSVRAVQAALPALVAALREARYDLANAREAGNSYLRGLILDRFIVPSNVTVSRIRAVVARVEET